MEGLARTARATTVASLAVIASLALAAGAPAQTPPAPTPPAPPAPAPAPVTAKLGVKVTAKHHDGKRQVALRGEKLLVTGTLVPFVANQTVTVRVRAGKRTVLKRQVAVGQAPDGRGVYAVGLRVKKRTGWLTVAAAHAATPELATTRSKRARLLVATPRLGYGSSGSLVRIFQRKLRALHYEARVTGRFDDATGRAVHAWRRVNGRSRTFTADSGVVKGVLLGRGGWKVRHPGAGHHVEADLSKQALALIDGDRVQHVYYTSSGAAATPTVIGQFRFYLKTPGTNAKGMVDSSYFIRGYAIHGYVSVPTYNASHGCLRVPIVNARGIFNWIRLGDRIFVSY